MKKTYIQPASTLITFAFEQHILDVSGGGSGSPQQNNSEVKGASETGDPSIGVQFANSTIWGNDDEAWGE